MKQSSFAISLKNLGLISSYLFLLVLLTSFPAEAASSLDGTKLSIYWAIPFVGILLSLAIFPLFAPNFWHKRFGFISFLWGAATVVMIYINFGMKETLSEIAVTYLDHFFPFIIFILSLYVITSGIKIDIKARATPIFNTAYMTLAGLLASWIGTTGAAMLFIQPFLVVNNNRLHKTHLMIFFIFIVCNIGGCLSAIGDPPLFLGFLNGISFFWPTTHLFPAFITVFLPLLIIFYGVDLYYYNREGEGVKTTKHIPFRFKITGRLNILFLLLAITLIILSGTIATDEGFDLGATVITYANILRDVGLLGLTYLSFKVSSKKVRTDNNFTWLPFLEVFKVFAAIFITAAPVLAILKAGSQGSLASLVTAVNSAQGPENELYFWITGLLSSMLDNAPTYLVFFNLAGGQADMLMTVFERTLIAISLGSVFMGAMTYIGNAPNFMVKAIAEQNRIRMPSFFGYLLWSCVVLLPLFWLTEILWIK